jgi:hypothetical protein
MMMLNEHSPLVILFVTSDPIPFEAHAQINMILRTVRIVGLLIFLSSHRNKGFLSAKPSVADKSRKPKNSALNLE